MIKKKKIIIWGIIGAVVVMFLMLFTGDQGFIQLYGSHKQLQQKALELQAAHKAIDSLHLELEKLDHDTAYIERIAREKLGMARKNEKIIKFVQEK